jgi:hypothetical protein
MASQGKGWKMGRISNSSWGKAALVVSVIALVAALVGGAYGLGRSSVKTKNLANRAVKAAKLGQITERSKPIQMPADTTAGDGVVSLGSADVACRPGEKAISGGGAYSGTDLTAEISLRSSYRNGNAWHVAMTNDSGEQQPGLAYVYCLQK